jgi:hypothetical protein
MGCLSKDELIHVGYILWIHLPDFNFSQVNCGEKIKQHVYYNLFYDSPSFSEKIITYAGISIKRRIGSFRAPSVSKELCPELVEG